MNCDSRESAEAMARVVIDEMLDFPNLKEDTREFIWQLRDLEFLSDSEAESYWDSSESRTEGEVNDNRSL